MTYTKENLREIFQQSYQQEVWNGVLRELFQAKTLKLQPEVIENTNDKTFGSFLGSLDTPDGYNIGLFHFDIKDSNIARKRVGLRQLVKHFVNPKWGLFDAALVVFVGEDNWRLSFVCDIKGDATAPKRYTFLFGDKNNRYNTAVNRFMQLQESGTTFANIKEAFSVEALSKEFYTRLYKWYEWALQKEMGITFPDILSSTNAESLNIKIIRLLTRLLFVWFIKQKDLVPEDLFSPSFLKGILKNFDKNSMSEGSYYNAVLQNLFFATLNCPIDDEGNHRSFATAKNTRDTKNKYRYSEMFLISEEQVVKMFDRIPYLNGGLFDCLDIPKYKKLDIEEDSVHDGFSRSSSQDKEGRYTQRAFVPNKLFFNEDENQPGLITLLKEYNFTVEENSTDDVEVSLDPELLGQVFENLLAAYNPETQVSARNATGSFYTPRVIVDYMVDEALIAYIKTKQIEGVTEENLRELFRTHTKNQEWNQGSIEAITMVLKEVKILDPACGSGAFPMGCLLRIVDIIEILHDNSLDRYNLKLQIIENCIHGVDIQSIAMLICKLRFFISLICDQQNIDFDDKSKENFGVNTLPNLETKFVAANTLISAKITTNKIDRQLFDEELNKQKKKLLEIRNRYLLARSYKEKIVCKNEDGEIRKHIKDYIEEQITAPDMTKIRESKEKLDSLRKEKERLENTEEILIQKQVIEQYDLFGKKSIEVKCTKKDRLTMVENLIRKEERCLRDEQNRKLLPELESAIEQITKWNPYDQNSVSPFFDAEWMFGVPNGFDIVIGNPPYISARGLSDSDRSAYEEEFGFSDDTYNLFSFKGLSLCKNNGTLTYIIPKTFWTIQTKLNMRELLLTNSIEYIFDTANPFESAMVDTCIIQIRKSPLIENHHIRFYNGTKSLNSPKAFEPIKQCMYVNAQNKVIFEPTELNLRIYNLYNDKVKALYEKWWEKIKTSREIERNKIELKKYRENLRPGDVTLLGCLTEGGQGLATANNGKYIAVRRSTKWASNIVSSRPKKLRDAIKKYKIKLPVLKNYDNEKEYLSSLSEKEIAQLFDSLKKKYGRDIFGQGYIYKIIGDDEIADVDKLSKKEKENGIDTSKKYYVPYDKGDKDGNRWYLETPFAIAWSKENVRFLKTNSGKKGEGMPVVRNSQFFFREGFCWTDVNSTYLKARIKANGIFDVLSMSLFSMTQIPNWFFVCLINSELISLYVDNFINNTSHFQINDARQLPIIIPSEQELSDLQKVYNDSIDTKLHSSQMIISSEIEADLQHKLDMLVRRIYHI